MKRNINKIKCREKSLPQDNFLIFSSSSTSLLSILNVLSLQQYYWQLGGGGRGRATCVADTKLVAVESPLISMTLSMLMMRNFSANFSDIINFFLFFYRYFVITIHCCCCCCCFCFCCIFLCYY